MAGCQTNPILGGGPAAVTTNSAGSCYSVCAAYAYAALTPANTGIFNCQCGMVLTPGTTANCDDNVAVVYRSTTVAPSGVARKRMLAARAAAERAALGDCPAGLTACRVPGGASSFECIDTQTELESCGGCSNGYYDDKKNLNATVGIDCSAINGVALGGSSCGGGKCKITRCRSGFDFENGACVRRLILPK